MNYQLRRMKRKTVGIYITKEGEIEVRAPRSVSEAEIDRLVQVRITSAKTRWGSGSAKGGLNFSWRLLCAPPEAMDYVVVHELAHLIEFNHSSRFWAIVEGILPDYKARRQSLKEVQESLLRQGW